MFSFIRNLLFIELAAAALAAATVDTLAAAQTVDCTKGKDLQKEIDNATNGDTLEIRGVCMQNIVIRDKALTLVGHASPGPHGITGVAAETDGVRIESSRGTTLQDLTISNPNFTCVRIRFHSVVRMTDVQVMDCGADIPTRATGIWVQEGSLFSGLRLGLEDNLRGLGAASQSQAFCHECDLNDNANWAATAIDSSLVTLLDSAVTGARGINALRQSYIDIDCVSHSSAHPCSLVVTDVAGLANLQSTVVFFVAGNFEGDIRAFDRSKVQLLGARQQAVPNSNIIDGDSSLEVREFLGEPSRVMGHTEVSGFSHALFHDASTVLDGSLSCSAAGDAWVDGAIDLVTPGFAISGCDHAP